MYFSQEEHLRSQYCNTRRVLANSQYVRTCEENTIHGRVATNFLSSQAAFLQPAVICLIKRAAGNLINFQAVVKNKAE